MSGRTTKTRGRAAPLLKLSGPTRVTAHRARFTPYASTRFLDAKALSRARSATIEVGTLEAAGAKVTVAAEIRGGRVVALKPIGCENCGPKGRAPAKGPHARALKAASAAIAERGLVEPFESFPVKISSRAGFQIPIWPGRHGPIIIIVGDPNGTGTFDFCVQWSTSSSEICWWCLIGESGCMRLGW